MTRKDGFLLGKEAIFNVPFLGSCCKINFGMLHRQAPRFLKEGIWEEVVGVEAVYKVALIS